VQRGRLTRAEVTSEVSTAIERCAEGDVGAENGALEIVDGGPSGLAPSGEIRRAGAP
jgi:hypothetical protein